MQPGSSHRYLYWAVSLWLLIGGYQIWKLRQAPIGDFANYYYASQALLGGEVEDAQLYEPYTFNLWVNQRSPEPVFVNYAPVPPVSVLAYLPFAMISDVYQAKLVFNVIGLLFFVLVFIWGMRKLPQQRQIGQQGESELSPLGLHSPILPTLAIISIPFILWTPLFNNFFQGQSYLYMVSFLWLGFICWQKDQKLLAAFSWAVPIALKIFPAIILLLPLLKRSYSIFGWTVTLAFLFSVLPVFGMDYSTVSAYFQDILPRLFAGEINDPYTILYQSPRVFIDQLLIYDGHLNDNPLFHLPWLANLLYLAFQWFILGLLLPLISKRELPVFLAFSLTIIAGLLLSGYGSNYSMLLLFFPAVAIVATGLFPKPWPWMGALALLWLAGNIPIYKLEEWPFLTQFPRMYALLILFVGIYWWVRPGVQPKIWLAIGGILLLKWGWSGTPQNQLAAYYLPDGQYPIIFDCEPTGDGLLLKHFRGQGPEEDIYPTSDRIYGDPQLSIQDQQVFYAGQQLTTNKGRKKRAMRLNEDEIIYLSDEGRGVGFYTLRKLKLP
ncbi:MAG: DUF2029 domain-containing protein [Saprospiraceae bacterium]|nr:DUF2029 domain-containing protein [Saprospiraceae bacterium]